MVISEKNYSNEREQISKNDEVKVSGVIEDLKVGKLSSHQYEDNVETKYDKRNQVDIIDYKDSDERDEISRNDEETLTDVDEESDKIDQI